MEYQTKSHCKFLLIIHMLVVVKYRKPLLKGSLANDLKGHLLKLAQHSEFDIEEMEVDKDHIHILISITPSYSVSQYLWLTYPSLKRHFWKEKTFWSDRYFACSIGNASEESIRKYIQEQG